MKIDLDRNDNFFIITGIIQLVILFILILTNDFEVASYSAFIQTVLCCIIIIKKFGLISLPTIFCLLTYVFHCSQFLLYAIGAKYDVAFDLVKLFGEEFCISIMTFYTIGIYFFTMGIFVVLDIKVNKPGMNLAIDDKLCEKIGKVLLIVCVIPRILTDISNLKAYLNTGYESTFIGERGLVLTFAYGFYIGMLLLLVGNRTNIKKAFKLLVFFVIYLLITMFSGRRLEQTGVLVAMLIIYVRYCKCKKVVASKLLLSIIVWYVLIAVIATFGDLRHSNVVSFDVYIKRFFENLKGAMVVGQFAEFGDTGVVLGYSMKSFPKYHDFHFGLTYILAWFQVFPNVGGIIQKLFATSITASAAIPNIYQGNYGSSFLGELYFNFGWFGTVVMFVIGYFIGKISRMVDDAMCKNNITLPTIMNIVIMPIIITFVRGSFSDFIRVYVYYYIIIYLLVPKTAQTKSNRTLVSM